jgi:hypothetical protein
VALLDAQHKTLHFMDGASLYLRQYSYAIFAQSAKMAQKGLTKCTANGFEGSLSSDGISVS